jgi:hypothetical protein
MYDIVTFIQLGFAVESSIWTLGLGIPLVTGFAVYFFSRYVKRSIEKSKAIGKALMGTAILFSYGCFATIYYLFYIERTEATADVFMIYYIVSIISSLLMSLALIFIYKRTRQVREVQLTRRELALFFNH